MKESTWLNSEELYELLNNLKGKVAVAPAIEPVNLYQKETVEHLVDQLIKLQDTYTTTYNKNAYVDKKQIYIAMESINKALEMVLKNELVIK